MSGTAENIIYIGLKTIARKKNFEIRLEVYFAQNFNLPQKDCSTLTETRFNGTGSKTWPTNGDYFQYWYIRFPKLI